MNDEFEPPAAITPDEAFRAAFYMALGYFGRGADPSGDLMLFVQYLWSDPARWDDWKEALRAALADGGLADPDHEGRWQDRGDWPNYRRP
jgi:hypothetical protein